MSALALPAIVYGTRGEVDARVRTAVRELSHGTPWIDALGASTTLVVEDTPGYIVLDGPSALLDEEPHFHLFVPWLRALQRIDAGAVSGELADAVFADSLTEAWGVLGLVARASLGWVLPPGRQRPLVEAANTHWPAFEAVGGRYSNGSRAPQSLSTLSTSLHYALGQLGIPDAALGQPICSAALAEMAHEPHDR